MDNVVEKINNIKNIDDFLTFEPPFVIKTVDEKESEYYTFEEDIYHTMDWGLYLDNYLGGDIYATEYFEIEWIKVRPRILKKQGKLIPDKIIDETEEFVAVLQKYSIGYMILLQKK